MLVVDDHDPLRASIVSTLKDEPDIQVIGEAKNGVEAVDKARTLEPEVVIMDIGMPLMDGIEATEMITNTRHSPKVLIISQYDEEEYIRNCMKAGASGYLLKDGLVSELSKAIRVVHAGGHFFTPCVAQRIVGFYLKQVVSAQHP